MIDVSVNIKGVLHVDVIDVGGHFRVPHFRDVAQGLRLRLAFACEGNSQYRIDAVEQMVRLNDDDAVIAPRLGIVPKIRRDHHAGAGGNQEILRDFLLG